MICCSIVAQNYLKAIQEMLRVRSKADIIEIRLDYIKDLNDNSIEEIVAKKPCPLIMTCRKDDEGGKFEGSEEKRIGRTL